VLPSYEAANALPVSARVNELVHQSYLLFISHMLVPTAVLFVMLVAYIMLDK
jgi:hypothetical protein